MLLAAGPSYPEAPAELSTELGWVALAVLAMVALWAWGRAETVRRALLAREDPRIFAILRVSLAAVTFQTFWNMRPLWHLLWSADGMFALPEARQRFGGAALQGWTDVDGFLDARGVWWFWTHKHSLLFFHGSATFVDAYLYVLFAVLLLYAIGLRTRVNGVVAWLMIVGLYSHNSVYLEGTDTVIKAVWFPMIFARTDAAWSMDAWIRKRVVARRVPGSIAWAQVTDRASHWVYLAWWIGLAAALCALPTWPAFAVAGLGLVLAVARGWLERDVPVPEESAPRVPCWPRHLIAAQVAAIYLTTGLVKTGSVWGKGDALYYALSMDHFYRFEGPTQWLAATFGLNLFRLSTWIVHAWEIGFPLVLLGLWLRFELRAEEEPWRGQAPESTSRLRRGVALGAAVLAYLLVYWFSVRSVPHLQPLPRGGPARDPGPALRSAHLTFAVLVPVLVAGWLSLARWPLRLRLRERTFVIDRRAVRDWLLGRRVWLGIGVLFHTALIVLMNIGTFPFIMMWTYLAFFESEELLAGPRRLLAWRGREDGRLSGWLAPMARRPGPADHVGGPLAAPLAWGLARFGRAPASVGGRVPDAAVLGLGGLGFVLAWARTTSAGERFEAWGLSVDDAGVVEAWTSWLFGYVVLVLLTGLVAGLRPRDPLDEPPLSRRGPSLRPGALARSGALLLMVTHFVCVGAYLFPAYPVYDPWRKPTKLALQRWLDATNTRQSWRMFAPNPPSSNTFMITHVITMDGETIDLGLDAYTDRPRVFLINDRQRKMNRRMLGKGKWYLDYWGRAQCRLWAAEHEGRPPREIQVFRVVTKIPTPEKAHTDGPIDPRGLAPKRTRVKTIPCDRALTPDWLRRHGYALDEHDRMEEEVRADAARRRSEQRRERWLQGD